MRTKFPPLIFLPLIALTLIGCQPQHSSVVSEKEQPSVVQSDALIVTEVAVDPMAATAVDEVSMLRPHMAILKLQNLQPGTRYRMQWKLIDETGDELSLEALSFTPTHEAWIIWQTFAPNHLKQKAGTWKWTAAVDGVGRFEKSFTVLPPTPSDIAQLARFEQAREEVFRAFSHYWLGYDDQFFTVISAKTETVETDPLASRLHKTRVRREELILQVGGLGYTFTHGHVSEADQLNGLSYKGSASFSFRVYRDYSYSRIGWSPWKDSNSAANDEATRLFYQQFWINPWEGFSKGFNLRFQIELKDGHWWVATDSGDLFANGKLVRSAQPPARQASQPFLSEIKRISQSKGLHRVSDESLGSGVKSMPEDVDRNRINTMTMLRGRGLR